MTNRIAVLALFLLFAATLATLHAQSSPASDSSSPAVVATTPVAAGAPIVEYAPPPAEYARAKAYSNSHYRHVFIGAFYGFLILLVILRWRVAPAFRNLAERASSSRFVQRIIFAPLILFTIAVLGIPSDIWDESLQRAYGLSVQTWGAWTRDWILGQAIMLIVAPCSSAFSTASFAAARAAGGSTSGSLPFPSCC